MKLFLSALLIAALSDAPSTDCSFKTSTFLVEHARTGKQIAWGLMQRRSLPKNQGMLFHYPYCQKVNFWSFNCHIDLSIAFVDENKIVREIKSLKAFPQKMDSSRPVFSPQDFNLYPMSDPIVIFFQEKSVKSSMPIKYVLEMNLGWFEQNQVHVGDTLHWDESNNSAFFTHEATKHNFLN